MTLESKENILAVCSKRNDQLAKDVKERVINCVDLVQVEARYHDSCRSKFRVGTVNEKNDEETHRGRPLDEQKALWFEQICDWMESEAELYT